MVRYPGVFKLRRGNAWPKTSVDHNLRMDWDAPWPNTEGERLSLVLATLYDAKDLCATADLSTFDYFSTVRPASLGDDDFTDFLRRLLALPNQRTYTMRTREGRAVGCSSFLDIRSAHRGLEVGFTWIASWARGTKVNPEAKLLMLGFAFERLGALRIQLKCDARNEHSAAAIAKLGARFEGRLRRHIVMPDGYVRDTMMFSVTDAEWPEVRAGLETRLVG